MSDLLVRASMLNFHSKAARVRIAVVFAYMTHKACMRPQRGFEISIHIQGSTEHITCATNASRLTPASVVLISCLDPAPSRHSLAMHAFRRATPKPSSTQLNPTHRNSSSSKLKSGAHLGRGIR